MQCPTAHKNCHTRGFPINSRVVCSIPLSVSKIPLAIIEQVDEILQVLEQDQHARSWLRQDIRKRGGFSL